MKLHIVVPTIMTNPEQEFKCLGQLVSQLDKHKLDFTVHFVANIPIVEFNEYTPSDKRIIKSISNLEFSISRALNSVFQLADYKDDDILAFVQSDAFFDNDNWVLDLIEIVNTPELNVGVVGVRPHISSNEIGPAIDYKGKFNLHPVMWSDGVMFFKGEVYRTVGGFDENYFGDCESQDFCYLASKCGYINYWCSDDNGYFGYKNKAASFSSKARFNKKEFSQKVSSSRKYLKNKWSSYGK